MKQYIEFTLGHESYAIGIGYVREIIKPIKITKLVGAPEFIKGVSKVRNEVITIIDLHQKFNIDSAFCETGESRIIILDFNSENVGLIVDNVVEILESENLESLSSIIHFEIISEIVKLEDRIIPIMNLERLFSNEVTQWLNSE
ncbi:MAG: hypothetical protein APF81_15715 [Desulfosporosinus sp. BRH_c37]|nr:MAG: hypothetical protein APF81_15715 [Desulfosporosinus sp. BRH_c37]